MLSCHPERILNFRETVVCGSGEEISNGGQDGNVLLAQGTFHNFNLSRAQCPILFST